MARRLSLLLLLVTALLVPTAPAFAGATVSVSPGTVDATYATTVSVSGRGFQSVKGGHGGIYVAFGTVKPGWQPSKGGVTGEDYLYVPDTEAKDNEGFQKYVAFPGSDTASSANGGVMSASGSWSTQVVVPGAVFQAYDRAGKVTSVDCRKVTCGIITIGAHGVKNARNETFTPLTVAASSTTEQPAEPTGEASVASGATADPSAAPDATDAPGKPQQGAAATATLEVDRASAVAGNVLAFTARGLPAGSQVSAVFDDGAAGAGPFLVGADGTLAGVITLPATTPAGTHELRLYGVADPPSVMFAVQAGETVTDVASQSTSEDDELRAAWLFAGAAALVLLVALVRLGLRLRGKRAA